MEEQIFEILNESFKRNLIYGRPATIKEASEKAVKEFTNFIKWKDHLKNEINTCFNPDDKSRPKVCYERNGKHYTLEELYTYYQNHKT